MSVVSARNRAEKLIVEQGIRSLPVKVDQVAKHLGLRVELADLGPDVSGLLVTKDDRSHIFVHEDHAPKRQRFTIAHEVGHFVLGHQFTDGEHVHVDRGNFISQRGPRASAGIDPREIEANQFAASLLMPERLVRQKVATIAGEGPLLDHHVSLLAEECNVSDQAMTIRLTSMGLL